ncbi:hypothetical protein LEAN103870_09695 [Legionella anisa]|uniref:Uncharacterized protein n=1 Tax=Legionella anisa TaxID=28082 RepID=A0AAX0WWL4_9GAMM|nr:hypothetical protein [Legionella anisa]AWN73334.1 hypothetical protein DLD14_05470 [Legionella anisa]KTC69851.1 hypothetical protein Lani_2557 [Legionella anisa]MBN5934115.1 hypothetical protein [Legionella anisa]MCW8426194.1 hypothetical protein [Legionella anisa]MCW8447856.1 hypothetical protein [Legionella anisa]
MQSKLEKLLENSRFKSNEESIARLQSSDGSNLYSIVLLCQENIKLLNTLTSPEQDEEFYDVFYDAELQLELINKLGSYYLTLYKTLISIKNPTARDELDQVKYRKLAEEYNSEEVKKMDMELERVQLDADYSLALYLNDLEDNEVSQKYSRQRFFNIEPEDNLEPRNDEEENPSKKRRLFL